MKTRHLNGFLLAIHALRLGRAHRRCSHSRQFLPLQPVMLLLLSQRRSRLPIPSLPLMILSCRCTRIPTPTMCMTSKCRARRRVHPSRVNLQATGKRKQWHRKTVSFRLYLRTSLTKKTRRMIPWCIPLDLLDQTFSRDCTRSLHQGPQSHHLVGKSVVGRLSKLFHFPPSAARTLR